MTTLLIVRHGYSCANKENRFSGQMDVPLNEVGRRQAEELGDILRGTLRWMPSMPATCLAPTIQ